MYIPSLPYIPYIYIEIYKSHVFIDHITPRFVLVLYIAFIASLVILDPSSALSQPRPRVKSSRFLGQKKQVVGRRSLLVGGFNPFEKYYSNWIISPGRGENKKCLKPPPSILLMVQKSGRNPMIYDRFFCTIPGGRRSIDILWVWPPPSTSDHQDCYISSRESL